MRARHSSSVYANARRPAWPVASRVCRRSPAACRFIYGDADPKPPPQWSTAHLHEIVLLLLGPEPHVLLVEGHIGPPGADGTARARVQIRPGSACSLCAAIIKGGPCDTTTTSQAASGPAQRGVAVPIATHPPWGSEETDEQLDPRPIGRPRGSVHLRSASLKLAKPPVKAEIGRAGETPTAGEGCIGSFPA